MCQVCEAQQAKTCTFKNGGNTYQINEGDVTEIKKTTYLYKPLSFNYKRNLARFRLGTLPLRSETANYLPKPVPVAAKLCLN